MGALFFNGSLEKGGKDTILAVPCFQGRLASRVCHGAPRRLGSSEGSRPIYSDGWPKNSTSGRSWCACPQKPRSKQPGISRRWWTTQLKYPGTARIRAGQIARDPLLPIALARLPTPSQQSLDLLRKACDVGVGHTHAESLAMPHEPMLEVRLLLVAGRHAPFPPCPGSPRREATLSERIGR